MKRFLLLLWIIPFTFLLSCGNATVNLVNAVTVRNMLNNDSSVILVDVRTKEEFDADHIQGAILLPLDTISQNAKSVIPEKDATYIIYCHSGNRSEEASSELVKMGYQNIYDLDGGILTWTYGLVPS